MSQLLGQIALVAIIQRRETIITFKKKKKNRFESLEVVNVKDQNEKSGTSTIKKITAKKSNIKDRSIKSSNDCSDSFFFD
jgi:hypothetical protein